MRKVEVITFNRGLRLLAADMSTITFRETGDLRLLEAGQRIPDTALVVDHHEPVHRVTDLDGQEHFLAMDPKTKELLTLCCDESLRKHSRRQEREIDSLKAQLGVMTIDRDYWRSGFNDINNDVNEASLWQRLKYLFTRRI